MQMRRIGKSGLQVSAIGLGCNNFGARIDFEASQKVVHAALDAGVTLFDTADTYGNQGGSEEHLGRILGARRADIVLATKFGNPMDDGPYKRGGARRYVMSAVEASLKRLRTDWIDLYQMHIPDPATPIEETLRALDDLVRQGKVRYIGCSNFDAWQVVESLWVSDRNLLDRFVSCQNQYSLLVRDIEPELLPVARRYGLGILPFYPLAGGFLTGKYEKGRPMPQDGRLSYTERLSARYINERNWRLSDALKTFAQDRGHSLLDIAFAWLLAHNEVPSVIAGATKPEQVTMNVAAGDWRLTADDMKAVERILQDGQN